MMFYFCCGMTTYKHKSYHYKNRAAEDIISTKNIYLESHLILTY